MKKLFYLSALMALVSCKQNTPTKADYMHRAMVSDTYKIVLVDVKRVKDSLALATKHPIDTTTVIFEYNMIGGMQKTEAKTIAQVKDVMKDETAFLKKIQVSLADKMAKDHLDSLKN
jgi:hypothetical protein